MRLQLLAIGLFYSAMTFGQSASNDTLVQLSNYTVNYSQKFRQPLEVWYKVKCPKDMTKRDSCITSNDWTTPIGIAVSPHKVYNSQWHHGHLAPVESFDCTCDDAKSTMNMLNCAMQDASLNKGMYLRLENLERRKALEADCVHVYIKLEFNDSTVVDGVRIPTGFFKTLIVDGIAESYYFPNSNPESKDLQHFLVAGEYGK